MPSMTQNRHLASALMLGGCLALVAFFGIDPVYAADTGSATGGPGLPWESPLDTLQRSFSGPVAFIVSLMGIIVCGATLIWGGEISEFVRRLIFVILVIAILVFANTMLTGVMFSGAVIPEGVSVPAELMAGK